MDKAIQAAYDDGVVIGLGSAGTPINRLDIDKFMVQEPAAFNLYLLALGKLQTDAGKMGYNEIAGIHGLPRVAWNKVEPAVQTWDNSPTANMKKTGYYCHHGLLSFPTWHRPYLVMLEQSIFKTMLDIVNKDFSSSPKYQDALRRFRLPYWDLYQPRGGATTRTDPNGGAITVNYDFGAPQILTAKKVMVLQSERSTELVSVDNPLYSFKFANAVKTMITGLNKSWTAQFSTEGTCRHPKAEKGYKESDVNDLNETLRDNQLDNVWRMVKLVTLEEYKNWRLWSNHGWSRDFGNKSDSIESFHDIYHNLIGGDNGHMRAPQIAAYDPVFWLHHCNIDRLIAVYQAINDSVWWPSKLNEREPPSDVPLYPFSKSAGGSSWWTSDGARKPETFGYTYEDLSGKKPKELANDFAKRYMWSHELDAKLPKDVKIYETRGAFKSPFLLSGTQIPSSLAPATSVPGTLSHNASNVIAQVAQQTTNAAQVALQATGELAGLQVADEPTEDDFTVAPNSGEKKRIPDNAKVTREWYVDTIADRLALNGTFTVFVFIGDFDEIPTTYSSASTLAGIAHFFIASPDDCENCTALGQAGAQVSHSITVTSTLGDYVTLGELGSLEPDDVVAFLVKNLKWRVVKMGEADRAVPTDNISGFEIHVNMSVLYTTPGSYVPVLADDVDYDEQVVRRIENGS